MPLTLEDRRRNGRKGALVAQLNNPDWTALTEAARAAGPGSIEYHENKVDPEGKLSPEQRLKLAKAAKDLYYLNLAEASRRARAARKAAREQA